MKKRFSASLVLIVALAMSAGLGGCFKDPINGPIDGTPVTPVIVTVPEDSISVDGIDNEDMPSERQHAFALSTRAPFFGSHDSTVVRLDTAGSVPRLTMKLRLSPMYSDESEARTARLQQVELRVDSMPVVGDEWTWLNNGEVRMRVRVADRPSPQYSTIGIVQQKNPPYTGDQPYARVFAWKLTAKRTIVLHYEAQASYSVQAQRGPDHDHQRVIGEVRFRY